ncbi:MAG TPA: hypothetical protein VFU47_07160, partial [Armatimonadota bacterium]|nr:hypothetical protein [Armatimonadota bacterium]
AHDRGHADGHVKVGALPLHQQAEDVVDVRLIQRQRALPRLRGLYRRRGLGGSGGGLARLPGLLRG